MLTFDAANTTVAACRCALTAAIIHLIDSERFEHVGCPLVRFGRVCLSLMMLVGRWNGCLVAACCRY